MQINKQGLTMSFISISDNNLDGFVIVSPLALEELCLVFCLRQDSLPFFLPA